MGDKTRGPVPRSAWDDVMKVAIIREFAAVLTAGPCAASLMSRGIAGSGYAIARGAPFALTHSRKTFRGSHGPFAHRSVFDCHRFQRPRHGPLRGFGIDPGDTSDLPCDRRCCAARCVLTGAL